MSCRSWWLVGCVGVLVAGASGCRESTEPESVGTLIKVTPASVSDPAAWRLFDRSTSSGFEPDPARRIDVVLDREEAVQALKIYGPAPYQLVVLGPAGVSLGLDRIDLSSLTKGWHTIPLPAVTTNALAFSFEPIHEATHDVVPEIELWAQRDEEPAPIDVVSLTTTDGMVTFAATTAADEIAPGACASFEVSLARPATQFVRTHLVYDARGPLRPWSLRRSINGTLEEGGRGSTAIRRPIHSSNGSIRARCKRGRTRSGSVRRPRRPRRRR